MHPVMSEIRLNFRRHVMQSKTSLQCYHYGYMQRLLFRISQGTVATFYRRSGQSYNPLA